MTEGQKDSAKAKGFSVFGFLHWLLSKSLVLGAVFVVLFSSHSCFLALKSSTFFSENIIIWVKTLPYFTHLNKKKVSFDEFFMMTWEGENESERKKEPQIPPHKESLKYELS